MNCRYLAILTMITLGLFHLSAQTSISVSDPVERFRFKPVQDSEQFVVGPVVPGNEYVITLMGGRHGSYQIEGLTGAEDRGDQYFFNRQFIATGTELYFEVTLRAGMEANDLLLSVADIFRLQSSKEHTESKATGLAKMMMGIDAIRNSDSEELVNSIFKNQSCFQTSNHVYDGVSGYWPPLNDTVSQLGTFTDGLSSIQMDQGMVIVNGLVREVLGPNDNFASGQGFNVIATDPDIIQLAGVNTPYDLVTIEFDFIPTTDEINFNYVFASEEYCSQLGFGSSDVFGFLISGPGISGPFSNNAVNIATLPTGSTMPGGRSEITVNSISPFVNVDLFNSNTVPSGFDQCLNVPPVALNDIQLDGFTDVLNASSEVIPCETYHLKLLLADAGDAFTNTAVFFQRGSFAGGLIDVSDPAATAESANIANAPLEGCSDGILTFSRVDSDVTNPVTVYFNVSTQSTATFGVDFTMPVDSLIIPAGQLSETLDIEIFGDDIAEGTETIVIQVTGTCNCEDFTSDFFIVDPPELMLSLDSPADDCSNTTVDLIPTVNGGEGVYSFSWSNGTVDSINNVTRAPGDSLLILTVTDDCDQELIDTAIVSAPDIKATLAGNYSLCDDPSIQIPVAVSGGTNYTIEIMENGNLASYSGTGDTIWVTYANPVDLSIVSVTADGCTGIGSGVARIVEPQFSVTNTPVDVTCRGAATGSISVNVNGDNSNFTFEWDDTTLSGASVNGLTAGVYAFRVIDSFGCTFDTLVEIFEPAIYSLSVNTPADDCPGTLVNLIPTVTGGAGNNSFQWSTSTTDSLEQITRLPGSTTYYVSVTDACGEQLNDSIIITSPNIQAEISGAESLCDSPNARIPVALSGGGTYSVVVNEGGTEVTYSGSGDTLWLNYTSAVNLQLVSVTSNGCSGTVNGIATVTDGSFSVSAAIQNIDCFGDTSGSLNIDVNGSPSAYTYNWTDPTLTGNNPENLTAGTYPVRILDPAGCFFDTSFMITEPTQALQISLDSIRDQSCVVAGYLEVMVSGGSGPYQLNWQDDNSNSLIRDNLTGGLEYILDVTDDSGCMTSDTFRPIDERATVIATITAPENVLTCSTTGITLSAGGNNTQPVDYEWFGPDGSPITTSDNLSITNPGTYRVSITDPANGCSAEDSFVITRTADTLALVFLDEYRLDCSINSVDLDIEATNFNGPATYSWFDEAMVQIGTGTTLAGITTEGIYTVRGIRDDNNCATTISTLVTVDREAPQVTAEFPTLLSCNSSIATSEVQVLNVANPEYSWSTIDGVFTGNASEQNITATQVGTYSLRVTNPDNGCFTNVSALLTVDERTLVANAGADQLLSCGDNPTILAATVSPNLAGTQFRWFNQSGEEISGDRNLIPTAGGTFMLEVTHPETGCTSTDEVTVNSEGPTSAVLTIQQPPCEEIGGTVTVSNVDGGLPPYSFLIDGQPNGNVTAGLLTSIPAGFHTLTIEDANGCRYEEEVQIVEPDEFTGSAENIEIRLGEVAILGVRTNRSTELSQLTWTAPVDLSCVNCPNPEANPMSSFTADVLITDADGCELRLSQNVFVDERNLVYTPNAFSPGIPDGLNDRFMIYADTRFVMNVNSFMIFDRWGNAVYSESDFLPGDESRGWNGENRGKMMPGGVYIFVTEVTLWDGRKELFRGTVNLVR